MEKAFNVLLDDPGECFQGASGRDYRINSDFRVILEYTRECQSKEWSEEKDINILFLLFASDEEKRDPEKAKEFLASALKDETELSEYLEWFINCGKMPDKDKPKAKEKPPVFDILCDSGRIFAAFLQVYGIDIRKEKLHWWIFCELLDDLPQEGSATKLDEVIGIRGKTFDDAKGAQKNALKALKKRYEIPGALQAAPLSSALNAWR